MGPWEGSLCVAAGLALLGLLQAWANALTFAPLPKLASEHAQRMVDEEQIWILVPARNEAQRILPLLQSFQAQKGDRLRLLVHDDASEDGTAELVRQAARQDDRIALQPGNGPPPGWSGKVHALHQLAAQAHAHGAQWLLFLDADVSLNSDGIGRAIATAKQEGLDALSLYPKQILGTWAERFFLPLMLYQFFLLAPQWLDALNFRVRVRPLNGQFLLWRMAAYQKVGGHAAISGAWLDDMEMGRHVAQSPIKVRYRAGHGVVSCRMYEGLTQLWYGFKKHHLSALNLPTWAFFTLQMSLFVAWLWPFVLLPEAWQMAWLSEAQCMAWAVLFSILVGLSWGPSWWRTQQGGWAALVHPLGAAFGLANALASWWGARQGQLKWKGRSAPPTKHSPS